MYKIYKLILVASCMLSVVSLDALADSDSSSLKSIASADDVARILSRYAQDYARYQATLGGKLQASKGAGVDVDVEHLISKMKAVVQEAKQNVAQLKADYETVPEWMRGLAPGRTEEYRQSIQKILRRLQVLQEVVAGLSTGKIERVRSKLTSLLQIYTVTYDELGKTYAANLQKLRDFKVFAGIKPENIYTFIGIGASEDPSKISFSSLKDHIKMRADIVKLQDSLKVSAVQDENAPTNGGSQASQWWLRQMGYLFPDAKAKERYDAWLAGKDAYESWQQAELAGLGMTADELGSIALQHVFNIGLFKAALDELQNNIKTVIAEIKRTTGIEPVPLSP